MWSGLGKACGLRCWSGATEKSVQNSSIECNTSYPIAPDVLSAHPPIKFLCAVAKDQWNGSGWFRVSALSRLEPNPWLLAFPRFPSRPLRPRLRLRNTIVFSIRKSGERIGSAGGRIFRNASGERSARITLRTKTPGFFSPMTMLDRGPTAGARMACLGSAIAKADCVFRYR